MKIAVDSNDGINLTSPRELKHNYFILEMDEKSVQSNFYTTRELHNKTHKLGQVQNINELLNIIDDSGRDVTLISRSVGRKTLDKVKKSGGNVYITFKKKIDEAISQYLKEKMMHEFLESN